MTETVADRRSGRTRPAASRYDDRSVPEDSRPLEHPAADGPAVVGTPAWRRAAVTGPDGAARELLVHDRPGGATNGSASPVALLAVPVLPPAGASVTLVLSGAPTPAARIGELLDRAVLAVECDLAPDAQTLAAAGASLAVVDSLELALVRGPEVLLQGPPTAAFPRAALQGTLAGPDARQLLDAVVGSTEDLVLRVTVALPAPPSVRREVQVDLGAVWHVLDAAADATRVFRDTDLRNYLRLWRAQGAVLAADSGVDDPSVLAAVLKAARPVLAVTPEDGVPDGDVLGAAYRLSAVDPGAQTVTVRVPVGSAGRPEPLLVETPLARLLRPLLADGPERVVHAVTLDGGRVEALLPVRSARTARGPGGLGALHLAQGGRIASLAGTLSLSATPAVATVIRPGALHVSELVLAADDDAGPGPVVADPSAPIWPDRTENGVVWYAPDFVLDPPDPTAPVEQSPFRFDVVPEIGHTPDGSRSISATITVRLRAAVPPDAATAAESVGAALRAVPLHDLTMQIGVPFRDEHAGARVEQVVAESVTVEGDLGAPAGGGSVTGVFRLADRWARLAYGALSTPGFQASAPTVTVGSAFEGWQHRRQLPVIAGLDKQWALQPVGRRARAWRPGLLNTLPGAAVLPPWQLRPEVLDGLRRYTWSWSRFPRAGVLDAVVPCAEHGATYREQVDGRWEAIGCRPGMELGQTPHVTYAPIDVAAAAGHASVYRSLRTPGRFLVVPLRYAVGRFEPDEGERAYRPALLLQTTLDGDDPTQIRCLLAASLQPDVPPHVRSAVVAELRRTAHPQPVLEWLPATGAAAELDWAVPAGVTVDAAPSALGFDVAITTDVASFLSCKVLLERDALRGSMRAELPGGVRLRSDLVIGTGAVTGPFHAGPVSVSVDRAGRAVVTNRVGRRVVVRSLASAGEPVLAVDRVLAPGEEIRVEPPDAGAFSADLEAVVALEGGAEPLEEIRAYVEDLHLEVVLVATGELGQSVTGLEVATRFLGRDDPAPLLLTAADREATRRYVLPLTAFAAEPVLELRVTAVADDGTRSEGTWTSWPVRSRGVLVPVAAP